MTTLVFWQDSFLSTAVFWVIVSCSLGRVFLFVNGLGLLQSGLLCQGLIKLIKLGYCGCDGRLGVG